MSFGDDITVECSVDRSNPPAEIHVMRAERPDVILPAITYTHKSQDGTYRVAARVSLKVDDKVPSQTYECSVSTTTVKARTSVIIHCKCRFKIDRPT